MHVVCGCFEVQGLTFKPSKAIFSQSSGTLGQRGCLSQHFAPQAGLHAGVVSACFIELLNKPPHCLAPSHGVFSEVKLLGRGPGMTFQPPRMGGTCPFDWGWSLAFGGMLEPCGGWPGGLAGSPSTLEVMGWSI